GPAVRARPALRGQLTGSGLTGHGQQAGRSVQRRGVRGGDHAPGLGAAADRVGRAHGQGAAARLAGVLRLRRQLPHDRDHVLNHHTILAHVNRVDRPLLVLNLLLLMGIVAVPFPTALVAEHLLEEGGTVATVTYGIVMIAISAGFAGVWVYVVTHARSLGAALPPSALPPSLPPFTPCRP